MKINVLSMNNSVLKQIELPKQFQEPVRLDLIKRAVLAIHANQRQPYGAKPEAGKRPSAKLSRRRRNYKGSYGIGISRVPRKIMSRRGTRMNWVGAFAPGTVKGRRAHPPKPDKDWQIKMNKKERRKAIRAAIAASMNAKMVELRGHRIPKEYPFIIDDSVEAVKKTKEVRDLLIKLGLNDELARISQATIRAGRGKMRGRKYRLKKGPLFVVSQDCALLQSAPNIRGIDVVNVQNLNASLLAPGCTPGRLTLYSEASIKRLEKEGLFMNDFKKMNIEAEPVKEKELKVGKKTEKKVAALPKLKKQIKKVNKE